MTGACLTVSQVQSIPWAEAPSSASASASPLLVTSVFVTPIVTRQLTGWIWLSLILTLYLRSRSDLYADEAEGWPLFSRARVHGSLVGATRAPAPLPILSLFAHPVF